MGTWIPINHVESQPFGHSDQHALEEAEVLLLHYKDHDYGGICSRDKVIATIEVILKEEERLKLDEEMVVLMEQAIVYAELAKCQLFVDKVNFRFFTIETILKHVFGEPLNLIHDVIEIDKFIVGG